MNLTQKAEIKKQSPKIGVTGASGFIGSFLVDSLQKNYSTQGLVRHPTSNPHHLHCSDYGEIEQIEKFLSDADILIHLANASLPRETPFSLVADVQENLIKTLKLFEAYYQRRPDGRIIFFSTGGVIYKSKSEKKPFREDDCVDPESSYGNQKFISENLLRLICTKRNYSATVLRVSNPYGILLDSHRKQGLIGVAATCAIKGETFNLFGRPEVIRDYIHLADLSSAVEKVVEQSSQRHGFELYNLGSGVGHTTQEVLDLISKYAPQKLNVNIKAHPSAEPLWSVLDISKFKNNYPWSIQNTFENGIADLFKSDG